MANSQLQNSVQPSSAESKELAKSVELARNGRLDDAVTVLERVLERQPDHFDALQLMGLVRRRQGNPVAAESLMRCSLESNPQQPHVLNNLGNVLRDQSNLQGAIDCYLKACVLQPRYAEAQLNLGITLLAAGDADRALEALNAALVIQPENAGAWASLGSALKRLGRLPEAEDAYRQAVELNPKHANALHNLGVLCKLTGRVAEALEKLDAAAHLAPGRAEIHYNRGHALLAAGRVDDALNAYRVAIQLKPDFAEAHDSLNKVSWQHGRMDGYLSSYAWALKRRPEATALWSDWAEKLTLAGRSGEAAANLERALSSGHESPGIYHRLACALAVLGRVNEAEAHFNTALALEPNNVRYLLDLGRFQIVQFQYEPALQKFERVLSVSPDNQEAIAYRGVCWRMLADPRETDLNDHERYVQQFRLSPPKGYPTIAEFNLALLRALEKLHLAAEAPAEQTLRGGTQTLDDLFDMGGRELDLLRQLFENAVREYVDQIDGDIEHPLVRRRTGGFQFSGSWSVRLRSGGFHVNHVHSQGWISSCYYVSVPDCVGDDDAKPGWLQFGDTNLHLGTRERTLKMIKPEAGLLVLFPSYFFHGTTPFHSVQNRVTVAFDVVPK